MTLIPRQDQEHYILNEKLSDPELTRNYLGLSMIGHECYRYLQYYHYWAFTKTTPSRIQRLFKVGHDAEDGLVKQIEGLGYEFGFAQYEVIGTGGHWKGHIDGVFTKIETEEPYLLGEALLGEFKTHNDKSFKDLKKKKVKESKPGHYDQMQSYMGYLRKVSTFAKMKRAMYVAINKNNSEIYIEFVDFDEERFNELRRKEAEVIMSDVLLPRIGNNSPTWFACKFCDARKVCFGRKPVEKNFRTDQSTDVEDHGFWSRGEEVVEAWMQPEEPKGYELADMFKGREK